MAAYISGLGEVALTRTPAHPGRMAVEAIDLAIADAGLRRSELDGLLIACSPAAHPDVRRWLTPNLAREAGFGGLRLLSTIDAEGSSSAAIRQAGGVAGRRQVEDAGHRPTVLAGNVGGVYDHHAVLIVAPGDEPAA